MTSNEATPTDSEREQANAIIAALWDAIEALEGPNPREVVAQALADQRAAIHAQYAAVADELEGHFEIDGVDPAERIRQVGQQ